ncbi:MAG: hypothetical protein KDC48_23525, partial [Planctomycetes bacterium]|nr:hypothetical protein [Planctomycetota bacterium]
NPASSLLQCHRIALGGYSVDAGVVDFWGNFGIASAWAFGLLVVGYMSFAGSKHKYADLV